MKQVWLLDSLRAAEQTQCAGKKHPHWSACHQRCSNESSPQLENVKMIAKYHTSSSSSSSSFMHWQKYNNQPPIFEYYPDETKQSWACIIHIYDHSSYLFSSHQTQLKFTSSSSLHSWSTVNSQRSLLLNLHGDQHLHSYYTMQNSSSFQYHNAQSNLEQTYQHVPPSMGTTTQQQCMSYSCSEYNNYLLSGSEPIVDFVSLDAEGQWAVLPEITSRNSVNWQTLGEEVVTDMQQYNYTHIAKRWSWRHQHWVCIWSRSQAKAS